jgi:hypothetical protein
VYKSRPPDAVFLATRARRGDEFAHDAARGRGQAFEVGAVDARRR